MHSKMSRRQEPPPTSSVNIKYDTADEIIGNELFGEHSKVCLHCVIPPIQEQQNKLCKYQHHHLLSLLKENKYATKRNWDFWSNYNKLIVIRK